jgi:hypothetical protein
MILFGIIIGILIIACMWRYKDMKFNEGIQFAVITVILENLLVGDKYEPLIHIAKWLAIVFMMIALILIIFYLETEHRKKIKIKCEK